MSYNKLSSLGPGKLDSFLTLLNNQESFNTSITTNSENIATNSANIASLSETVSTNTANIATNSADIATLKNASGSSSDNELLGSITFPLNSTNLSNFVLGYTDTSATESVKFLDYTILSSYITEFIINFGTKYSYLSYNPYTPSATNIPCFTFSTSIDDASSIDTTKPVYFNFMTFMNTTNSSNNNYKFTLENITSAQANALDNFYMEVPMFGIIFTLDKSTSDTSTIYTLKWSSKYREGRYSTNMTNYELVAANHLNKTTVYKRLFINDSMSAYLVPFTPAYYFPPILTNN